jgi:plastocyanin
MRASTDRGRIVSRTRVLVWATVAVAGAVFAALPASALADPEPGAPAVNVDAAGNPFTGGLAFTPATVHVTIGRIVQWTNTDFLVPHTATEDHGLWDLTGTYGVPGVSPPGFGPGAKVSRPFEAGTAHYYCQVHPTQMKGVVAVPVDLRLFGLRQKRSRTHEMPRVIRYVTATWALTPPASGEGFDVQIHRGEAAWQTVRSATRETGMIFRAGEGGTRWEVRARLRKAANAAAATDWSPVATIVSDQKPPNRRAKKRRRK